MKVLLLDGYNLLFRAFTSLPSAIVSRDGLPINAVYGTVSATIRLMRDLDATRVVVAFDTPDVPTFRHVLFPAYQGQRGPMGGENADDFARQVEIAFQVLPLAGVPAVRAPGFEADDVLGTLALRLAASGGQALIVSTDRDLLQLVRPGVEVISPGNPPIHARTEDDVIARLGVRPERVTDFKALAGDASDNIPGLSGIGTKSAATLVNEYGAIECIYDRLPEIPKRVAARLEGQLDTALLLRDVVTIRTDLPVDLDPSALPEPALRSDSRVRDVLDSSDTAGLNPWKGMWYARRDSNPRPLGPQPNALSS